VSPCLREKIQEGKFLYALALPPRKTGERGATRPPPFSPNWYNGSSGKKLDNRFCDQFINIGMAGNLGGRICPGIFVNVVACAVAYKNGSPPGDLFEQFLPFHAKTFSRKTPLFRFCASRFSSSCRIW
jgi:hypothetical protein